MITIFREFDTRWDEVLLSMVKNPSDDVLECLVCKKLTVRESAQLKKPVSELYDMEIHQKISVLNNQKFKTMVKRSIDQNLRLRNFDARFWRIETGAVVKNRKGLIGVEGGKRYLLPVERKRSVFARRPMQFPSRNPSSLPPHLLRQPYREVEVCRGREVSEAKVTMGPSSTTVQNIVLRGTCTRTSCEYWHPPECQVYQNEMGCEAGDKCLFSALQG